MEAKFNGGDGLFIFVPGYSLAGLSPRNTTPGGLRFMINLPKGR